MKEDCYKNSGEESGYWPIAAFWSSAAFPLPFLCLVSTLLFAQDPSSDLREAAAAGNAQAQFDLGNYYSRIRYATLDYAQFLTWYRKSASQGFAPAQNQLAGMYENNIDLPQDY